MKSQQKKDSPQECKARPTALERSQNPSGTIVDLGVDWVLLRKQKRDILEAIPDIARSKPVSRSVMEGIYGLIHLLDKVQDEAVETLGEQAVFGELVETESANQDGLADRTGGTLRRYTVVGLWPDEYWDQGMHEASFVEFAEADTPVAAAQAARLQVASRRVAPADATDEAAAHEESAELAARIEILAVFEGSHLMDRYDPTLDN